MSENPLSRVVKLGDALVKAQEFLEASEQRCAEAKKAVLLIEREELPTLMAELEMTEFRLKSGKRIRIERGVDCGISKANKPKAFAWLTKNGFGGIIKVLVEVQFGKGERDAAMKVSQELHKQYKDKEVVLEETVHPSTLKSFVKEQMEAGNPVPQDLFGVFTYNKAVVTD